MLRTILISVLLFASAAFANEEYENKVFYDVYNEIAQKAGNVDSLTPQQLRYALQHVVNHPVATLLNPETVRFYDPTGAIGFCFGRALATQLAARKLGAKASSVKKIFVIGDMRSGSKPEWRFHVTTIVKGANGKWWALDPIVPGRQPMLAEEWLRWVRSVWDKPGKTRAYVTSGDVQIPNIKTVPKAGAENNIDVMSTTFKPETHKGVVKLESAERFYDISGVEAAEFQKTQFISAKESGANRFNAATILINNVNRYNYGGYFKDLMDIFKKTRPVDIMGFGNFASRGRMATMAESIARVSRHAQNEMGSMRFDIIEADEDMENCLR